MLAALMELSAESRLDMAAASTAMNRKPIKPWGR